MAESGIFGYDGGSLSVEETFVHSRLRRWVIGTGLSLSLILPYATPSVAQTQPLPATTEADYWLDVTYGMAGSAIGNGAILLTVIGLDLAPGLIGQSGDWVNSAAPWLAFLILVPIASTTLMLHFAAPTPEGIETDFWQTLLGSSAGVILHTLLLIPLVLAFNQGSVSETFYLLAPAGFLSGVLTEGLVSALFHNQSRRWVVQASAPGTAGLMLVHRLAF
jgi:hypothetical protein